MGTPEYINSEEALSSGADIDTRTDARSPRALRLFPNQFQPIVAANRLFCGHARCTHSRYSKISAPEPEGFRQLGYGPNPIDLMTSITGVNFEDAWDTRVAENLTA